MATPLPVSVARQRSENTWCGEKPPGRNSALKSGSVTGATRSAKWVLSCAALSAATGSYSRDRDFAVTLTVPDAPAATENVIWVELPGSSVPRRQRALFLPWAIVQEPSGIEPDAAVIDACRPEAVTVRLTEVARSGPLFSTVAV